LLSIAREKKKEKSQLHFSPSLILSLNVQKNERRGEKKSVHFEIKYHSTSCCIFSLHTSTLVEKNVATSRENLISNKGEIKKEREIFAKTDGTF